MVAAGDERLALRPRPNETEQGFGVVDLRGVEEVGGDLGEGADGHDQGLAEESAEVVSSSSLLQRRDRCSHRPVIFPAFDCCCPFFSFPLNSLRLLHEH